MSWTSTPPAATLTWRDVACSSTGKYVIVSRSTFGKLYVSSDYGVNYTSYGISSTYNKVACDSTGQYQYAAAYTSSVFYKSTTYGATWSAAIIVTSSNDTVECDGTGQYIIIGSSISADYPYLSTDYGATFNQITGVPGTGYVISAALSSTGQYQYVFIYNFGIYVSSDYGSSWSVVFIDLSGTYQFNSMACDSTGQYLMAGNNLDNIYQSSSYGASLTNQGASSGAHYACQMTANGTYRLDSGRAAQGIRLSSNSGSTYSTGLLILASDVTGVALNTINA